MAIANNSTANYPLPESPLHPSTLFHLLPHVTADTAILPPAFVEAAANNPEMLALMSKKLNYVGFAGGPVSSVAGDSMARNVNFFCIYASTENGVYPTLRPQGFWIRERWNKSEFHPKAGLYFESVGGGEYELIVMRKAEKSVDCVSLQPVFKTFPNIDEWRTKDVFAVDPTEAGLLTYQSRLDDIITFNDGTTFNPRQYEEEVRISEEVAAALLFGMRKPDTVLLLELGEPRHMSAADHSAFGEIMASR